MASPAVVAVNPSQALEQTKKALEENRPWYQALTLQAETTEADAGQTVTRVVIAGVALLVDAVNVDALKPVCVGLNVLFEAVKGATAARAELVDLLSYCVLITSIILDNARAPELPTHIRTALRQVENEIKKILEIAKQFDAKMKCRLPWRRLCLHARDRERMNTHSAKLKDILQTATSAAVFTTAADVGALRCDLDKIMRPPVPDMAKVPTAALALPSSYVERTSLVSEVVCNLTAADAASAPYVLIGIGGGGKTVLASSIVRNKEIQEHFRQGIFWVRVGRGGKCQLQALFEGLAREVSVAPTVPHQFNSVDEVVRHLTQDVAEDTLPRLVVLDDVWEREVVDTLQSTGLQLLVTTRLSSAVAVEGGHKVVGNMEDGEARELLKKRSGAVRLPETEATQVIEDCGWHALTLAIAGSLLCVTASPNSAPAWGKLHSEIAQKKSTPRGLQMATDIGDDPTKRSLFAVLDLSLESLGQDEQHLFLSLVVLARGVLAPAPMLANLWEKDVRGARKEADFLVRNSLLQEVQGSFRLHDLLLDFIRITCQGEDALKQEAVGRQTQYLGTLAVLRGYADNGESLEGLYSLIRLWQSLVELSGNEQLEVNAYNTSLGELGEDESIDAAYIHSAVGRLFQLQGKYAEAEPIFERSQVILEKVLEPDHPDVAASLNNRRGCWRRRVSMRRPMPCMGGRLPLTKWFTGQTIQK